MTLSYHIFNLQLRRDLCLYSFKGYKKVGMSITAVEVKFPLPLDEALEWLYMPMLIGWAFLLADLKTSTESMPGYFPRLYSRFIFFKPVEPSNTLTSTNKVLDSIAILGSTRLSHSLILIPK